MPASIRNSAARTGFARWPRRSARTISASSSTSSRTTWPWAGRTIPAGSTCLEKGRDSVFANMFDIDWEPAQPNLRDKVLVPLLGAKPRDAVAAGEMSLIRDEALGKYAFAYAEHRFPAAQGGLRRSEARSGGGQHAGAVARAARAAEFPPRVLARCGRAYQLAAFLRHHRTGGVARRGRRRVRNHRTPRYSGFMPKA